VYVRDGQHARYFHIDILEPDVDNRIAGLRNERHMKLYKRVVLLPTCLDDTKVCIGVYRAF
jgi:hypothetical protein